MKPKRSTAARATQPDVMETETETISEPVADTMTEPEPEFDAAKVRKAAAVDEAERAAVTRYRIKAGWLKKRTGMEIVSEGDLAVRRITGRKIQEFMRKNILEPV